MPCALVPDDLSHILILEIRIVETFQLSDLWNYQMLHAMTLWAKA
jgi:hypothetical protein